MVGDLAETTSVPAPATAEPPPGNAGLALSDATSPQDPAGNPSTQGIDSKQGIDFASFDTYQAVALRTAMFNPKGLGKEGLIAFLGLASEAASLLNLIKKRFLLSGPPSLASSREFVAEELGDVLWYLAMAAHSVDVSLAEVAEQSIRKTRSRFPDRDDPFVLVPFDEAFPDQERLPRLMIFSFEDSQAPQGPLSATIRLLHAEPNAFPDGPVELPSGKKLGFQLGADLGDMLTDNSRRVDGYRFHDALHLAFAAHFGWSPVLRAMLRLKRKSQPDVDEVEDGARAIFTEEAVAAALARMAVRRHGFANETTVDSEVLDLVEALCRDLEIEQIPLSEWRAAVVAASGCLRKLHEHGGGYVVCDLDARSIEYVDPLADPSELIQAHRRGAVRTRP